MSELENLLKNNQRFVRRVQAEALPMRTLPQALPFVKAIIIGCADMRVDPALVFGIETGEAVVIRNIGGRVTPSLLQQLRLLGRIGQVAETVPGGGGEFNIVVLHHTDCGITRLNDDPDLLGGYFQVPESEVNRKAILNPRESVQVDVAELRKVDALPAGWLLSGLVYDVHTGLVETVVPPAPIREV